MAKLRVLVADDTTLMRRGLKSLLEKRETVEFVGEATSAQEARDLSGQLRPDVVLLDTDMPGLDAAEAVRLIKQRAPKVEIIALAETTDNHKALRVLEAGATGYVLKDINPDDLVRAIEAVCHGRTPMDPAVARQLVERLRTVVKETHADTSHLSGLSGRELEILMEMTHGATDRQIAAKLFLSTATVKSHIHSIFGKIGAKNRTQAVAYVLQNGFTNERMNA